MKSKTRLIRVLALFSLVVQNLAPLLAPAAVYADAGGEGNCALAAGYDKSEIIKDETWEDEDSTKTYKTEDGKIISVVFVKTGAKEESMCLTFTSDTTEGHYLISGIGTTTVIVTENGGQDVSHTEFVLKDSEPTPEACKEGEQWGYKVISHDQNGTNVAPDRSDTTQALGEADSVEGQSGNFYSLGLGGIITLAFEFPVMNVDGDDLSFHEETWGNRMAYMAETADVEVSYDGVEWRGIGTVSNHDALDGVSYLDFSSTGWDWIKYVRLTDTSAGGGDGYDLDAIDATSGVCEDLEPTFGSIASYKCEDTDGDGRIWATQYEDGEEMVDRCIAYNQGLNDWKIELYELVNGEEVYLQSTTTGVNTANSKNGYYSFDDLDITKVYRLKEVMQFGWEQTVPVISSGQEYQQVNFANFYNNNGHYDAGRSFANTRLYSKVTLCKVDENDKLLSGWELSLQNTTPSAEVYVPSGEPAKNTNVVVSMDLEAGSYVLVAEGTYRFANWGEAGVADAAFSYRPANQGYSFHDNDYTTWVAGDDLTGYEGYLEVRVDDTNVDWGELDIVNHHYELVYAHSGGQLDFTILDSSYGDNSGSINVKAYKLYSGTTEEDGCVTFENVEYGSYQIAEESRDKWENVSGLDLVEVDSESESFTVVNNFIDPYNLYIIKTLDAEEVIPGDVLVYELVYGNNGEDTAEDVVITETVPEGTHLPDDTGDWTCTDGTCTYDAGDLLGGEEKTITFTVIVDDVVDLNEIANVASIIGIGGTEEDTSDNTDDENTPVGEVEEEKKEEEKEKEEDDDNQDDNTGVVEGASTLKEAVLGVPFTPEVLGEETLAETGSATTWALILSGMVLTALSGAGVLLTRKKQK